MELYWIIIIIIVASLIKGITGFGFALVSLPPLMLWYSPKVLIPVLIFCNLVASVIIVLQKKDRKLVNQQFRSLIVFGAFFTIIGVITLKYIPEHLLIVLMSLFFILLSVFSLLGVRYSNKLSNLSYKIAGAFLGFLTGSISISGPPLALFMHSAKVDKQQFREIFAWFSIVTATIALAGYAIIGLLNYQTLKMSLLFLPILFAGSYFGKRLNHIMSPSLFTKISILLTLLSSVLLLFK